MVACASSRYCLAGATSAAAALALTIACGASALEIHGSAPWHVFVEGEALTFALTRAAGEAVPERAVVVDYAGRTVASPAPGREMRLPALPPGYYELRSSEAKLTSFVVVPRPGQRVPGDCPIGAACSFGELVAPEHQAEAGLLLADR
jgi:hypothetical protein